MHRRPRSTARPRATDHGSRRGQTRAERLGRAGNTLHGDLVAPDTAAHHGPVRRPPGAGMSSSPARSARSRARRDSGPAHAARSRRGTGWSHVECGSPEASHAPGLARDAVIHRAARTHWRCPPPPATPAGHRCRPCRMSFIGCSQGASSVRSKRRRGSGVRMGCSWGTSAASAGVRVHNQGYHWREARSPARRTGVPGAVPVMEATAQGSGRADAAGCAAGAGACPALSGAALRRSPVTSSMGARSRRADRWLPCVWSFLRALASAHRGTRSRLTSGSRAPVLARSRDRSTSRDQVRRSSRVHHTTVGCSAAWDLRGGLSGNRQSAARGGVKKARPPSATRERPGLS